MEATRKAYKKKLAGDSEFSRPNGLYSKKDKTCESLNCQKDCSNRLNFVEALLFINLNIQNSLCEKYILDIFWSAQLSEYMVFIPAIMNTLSPNKYNLIDYILTISSHNYEIANIFFWQLTFLVNHNETKNLDFFQDQQNK